MSSVKSNTRSGSSLIDDLLKSTSWTSPVITYAFSSQAATYGTGYGRGEANQFSALNLTQKTAAREAFAAWGDVANIKFNEVSESQAEIRLGVSSMPSTAWAYAPSSIAAGGDIWIGDASYNSRPDLGNYGWMTILHEIGHALGLGHPHEAISSSGGLSASWADKEAAEGLCPCCAGALHGQTPTPLSAKSMQASALDAMAYSVMSYRSFVGADMGRGYTNASDSYAQSPMARDIAAIQHLYGANYQTRAGDTVYRWSETTGEKFVDGKGSGAPVANKVFETIWDGDGIDTFDLSNFGKGVKVDLRPGQWSSFGNGQHADLGAGQLSPGNVAVAYLHGDDVRSLIENVIGGAGGDVITGNSADNVLIGGGGDDTLFGMEGNNILVGDALGKELNIIGIDAPALPKSAFGGDSAAGDNTLVGGAGNDIFIPGWGNNLVEGGGGTDTLILDLNFGDLTIEKNNGSFIFVHANGEVDATGIELLAVRDGIYSLVGGFESSDTKAQDVALLYQASLGRETDAEGLKFWLGEIEESGMLSMAQSMINSTEFSQRFGDQDAMTAEAFVAVLYENVLGRSAMPSETAYWVDQLVIGTDRAEVLLAFAQSDENRANFAAPVSSGELDFIAVSHAQLAQIWA